MISTGGLFLAADGKINMAILCLMASGFLDLFDGMVARTKKDRTEEQKNFGIQIDSLTDVICFGALPALIAYMSGMRSVWQIMILLVFTTCGMIRLGYYNVTEQQRQASTAEVRKAYCGLPITSSSLVVPFAFLFRESMTATAFEIFLSVFMLLCGIAFITPVRVRKPHGKSIAALVLIGIVLIGLFLIIP
jgi:CDP-diacylglycerol--serine O-phosphatidyltransferase